MAFELRQNLKLTQQLIMTPQLQQAIKLLQMSRLDLVDMVNQEMEENPLLEEVTSDEDPEAEKKIEPAETAEEDREEQQTGRADRGADGRGGRPGGVRLGQLSGRLWSDGGHLRPARRGPPLPGTISWSAKPSLTDHLMWQLRLSRSARMRTASANRSSATWIRTAIWLPPLDEIAVQEKVAPDFVEEVLKKVQEFDPVGIAARDLRECLLIQAKMMGNARSLVERIILDHLKDLEIKNYAHIARKLKDVHR